MSDKLQKEIDAMMEFIANTLGTDLSSISFSYECYYCQKGSDEPVCQECLNNGRPNGYWNEYKDFVIYP